MVICEYDVALPLTIPRRMSIKSFSFYKSNIFLSCCSRHSKSIYQTKIIYILYGDDYDMIEHSCMEIF